MNKNILYIATVICLTSCGGSEDNTSYNSDVISEDGYSDGSYCAEVDYYNPNTGTSSTYTLEVEVESNEITTIHWPNGGWLDDSHFSSTDISGGYASFTSDNGYDYKVRIIGESGSCYTDTYIEEDTEESSDIIYTEEEDTYNSDASYSTDEEI